MGAETFEERGEGKSAQEVFDKLVEEAAYDHGHGGYTGTIAEKSEFVVISAPNESVRKELHAKAVEKANKSVLYQKAQVAYWETKVASGKHTYANEALQGQKATLAKAEAALAELLTTDPTRNPDIMEEYARYLINEGDDRVDDKWGPAGCICVKEPTATEPGEWIFFGWASS
jgi:hypothetical protein